MRKLVAALVAAALLSLCACGTAPEAQAPQADGLQTIPSPESPLSKDPAPVSDEEEPVEIGRASCRERV